jgi:hypothetical protein
MAKAIDRLTARRQSDLLGLVDDSLAPRYTTLNTRYATCNGARLYERRESSIETAGRRGVETANRFRNAVVV